MKARFFVHADYGKHDVAEKIIKSFESLGLHKFMLTPFHDELKRIQKLEETAE